jgi:coenzyme F420-0:L-glutamate ligase/coenzyme F420-1:gamma-L-glutamate ligase
MPIPTDSMVSSMNASPTTNFSVFAVEPFPEVRPGDDLARVIVEVLDRWAVELLDGDIVVVASKVVSIAEQRYVDFASVAISAEAADLARATGKPAALVQVILDESVDRFLATPSGPIIAWHRRGYQLTSAGVDRADDRGAWLLPADPDASARALRDAIVDATGVKVAVVIADSDGRADRRGATAISIGASGAAPVRVTEYRQPSGATRKQEETFTDLVAAAAGLVLGQRGRGAPVAVVRGVHYESSDDGVAAMLHRA